MGQLFFWTKRVGEALQEEFSDRFGFDVPDPLLELHESLPEEFIRLFRFHSIERILEESKRPPMLMPGLVPFAEEGDGDLFCFYLPWADEYKQPPLGIWMNDTNHFLPIASHMQSFLAWWLIKETFDAATGDDFDEMRKMLDIFQNSCGLDELDLFTPPLNSDLDWHENILRIDSHALFSQVFSAIRQFAVKGYTTTLELLKTAESHLPRFGAPSLWQARFAAMNGKISMAHDAYWRHLRTPMFANGYHYLWHAGDLQIPEFSEPEALNFFLTAEIPPKREILEHPKIKFLKEENSKDYHKRLDLAYTLEEIGDFEGALVEIENAFFLEGWNDDAAEEVLERLLSTYPEHNRMREAEQCRRTLEILRSRHLHNPV